MNRLVLKAILLSTALAACGVRAPPRPPRPEPRPAAGDPSLPRPPPPTAPSMPPDAGTTAPSEPAMPEADATP